jgi:hypothetical protein
MRLTSPHLAAAKRRCGGHSWTDVAIISSIAVERADAPRAGELLTEFVA